MPVRASLLRSSYVALAGSLVAALCPAAPAAASPGPLRSAAAVSSFQDTRNDVEGEAGPVSQPEADIVSVSTEHRGDEIVLNLLTAAPTDPATHPAWAGDTMVVWGLSGTQRAEAEYLVAYGRDDTGRVVFGVVSLANPDAPPSCSGPGGRGPDGAYRVAFPASCVGSPASLYYGGAIGWDNGSPDGPVADGAPENDLAGPVDGPAAPPPAVTDDPDPSYHPGDGGYWLTATDGGVFSFGDAKFYGSTGGMRLNQPIVAMTADPDHSGYWFVAKDGGVFAFEAPFFGSTGNIKLNKPIVGMAATPSGLGYWMVASDGGIFAFGDAGFYGSTGNIRLSQPIVGMTPTASGRGYWMVAQDGGIFAFGDANFFGSTGGMKLSHPIVGMTRTPTGAGYWFVDRAGSIFSFGDARYFGNAESTSAAAPVAGMATARDGAGYSIVRADGSVTHLGSAPKAGSLAGRPLNQPITAIAIVP